jgi:hypothetical protein
MDNVPASIQAEFLLREKDFLQRLLIKHLSMLNLRSDVPWKHDRIRGGRPRLFLGGLLQKLLNDGYDFLAGIFQQVV